MKYCANYSRHKSLFALAVAVIAAVLSFQAMADAGVQVFFVSGILQKIDSPTTVKLVHIVQAATSRATAEDAFKDKVRKDFPGYKPIDMITTPQSDIRAPDCVDRRLLTDI